VSYDRRVDHKSEKKNLGRRGGDTISSAFEKGMGKDFRKKGGLGSGEIGKKDLQRKRGRGAIPKKNVEIPGKCTN